jgi:hypothetical protein
MTLLWNGSETRSILTKYVKNKKSIVKDGRVFRTFFVKILLFWSVS